MDNLERLKLRTGEADEDILLDCLESAKAAIQSRRFPFGNSTADLEPQYLDLQFRCAMDIYNKIGAEGQIIHDENGIRRNYESAWISSQLLQEVTPYAGVPE